MFLFYFSGIYNHWNFFYFCRENRNVTMAKVRDGKRVLELWKSSYFEVREVIEKSGRESRWEFDRKRLFDRSDYMASVCQDLYDILQVRSPSKKNGLDN